MDATCDIAPARILHAAIAAVASRRTVMGVWLQSLPLPPGQDRRSLLNPTKFPERRRL